MSRWAEIALAVLALVLLLACTRSGGSSSTAARPNPSARPSAAQTSGPPGGSSPTTAPRPSDLSTSTSSIAGGAGTGSVAPGGPPGCGSAADLARSGDSAWGESLSLLVKARALVNDTSNPLAADAQLRALVPTARDVGRRLVADGQTYALIGQAPDAAQPARVVADAEQSLGGALAAVDRIDDLAVVATSTGPSGAPTADVIARIESARLAVARWAASTCSVQLPTMIPGQAGGGR